MSPSFEYRPVEWLTAGAVGEPGERTFYIQARPAAGDTVSLLVEKEQVRMLAQLAQELLGRVDVTVTPDDLDTAGQRLREPVDPAWRAGSMSLGMESGGGQFLLEVEELVDDEREPSVARFWMSSEQLVALAAHAAYAVEAGARERCRLCGRPVDPVDGHVCPATNGHGPLTV